MKIKVLLFLVLVILVSACSHKPEMESAIIKGKITVDPSVDTTRDYSGINVAVVMNDTAGTVDTLYDAVTDTAGIFEGTARFKQSGGYTMIIKRNDHAFGNTGILLGNHDTVTVGGVLPDLNKTFTVASKENTAYKEFQRVAAGYQRVVNYAGVGALPSDTIPKLLVMWSKLFWSIQNDHPGSIAAKQGKEESIRILAGVNDTLLLKRFRSLKDEATQSDLARTAANAVARLKNMDSAIHFLDSLENSARETSAKINYGGTIVQMLYDSTRIDEAKKALSDFEQRFGQKNKSILSWASNIRYDLDSLSYGDVMPSFKVGTLKRDTVTNASFSGHPYILEITALTSQDYQQEYPQLQAIYSIYKKLGLKMLTVPIDSSNVTIKAFLGERKQDWPFGSANAYKVSDMLKTLNVKNVPTRFLVDEKGKIIRKYGPNGTNRMLQDLTSVMAKKKAAKK